MKLLKITELDLKTGLATLVLLGLMAGCSSEPPIGPEHVSNIAQSANHEESGFVQADQRSGDLSDDVSCVAATGLFSPDGDLKLEIGDSEVKYNKHGVTDPTFVSFSLCDLDPTGPNLAPKALVLGPDAGQTFLEEVEVKLTLTDAGLDPDLENDTEFFLFRQDEFTSEWELILSDETSGDELKYSVFRNGTYAVSLEYSCIGSSGMLLPDDDLKLETGESKVEYEKFSVLSPTLVSVSICDMDATGTNLAPKAMVLGPEPGQVFRQEVSVEWKLVDAGLDPDLRDHTKYYLFRQNESNANWELVLSGEVEGDKLKFGVFRNGTYAVSVDSVWTSVGLITPGSGGTIDVLWSNLTVDRHAITNATVVSVTLRGGDLSAVPGALPTIYEFGPEGLNFQTPAHLSVSFQDAGYEGAYYGDNPYATEKLYLYYDDPETGTWVRQENPVEVRNGYLYVNLDHFSRYAFGR